MCANFLVAHVCTEPDTLLINKFKTTENQKKRIKTKAEIERANEGHLNL